MILKVSCPACKKAYRLTPPYPPPGKRYRCVCHTVITVSYPPEIKTMLEAEGAFQDSPAPEQAGGQSSGQASGTSPRARTEDEVTAKMAPVSLPAPSPSPAIPPGTKAPVQERQRLERSDAVTEAASSPLPASSQSLAGPGSESMTGASAAPSSESMTGASAGPGSESMTGVSAAPSSESMTGAPAAQPGPPVGPATRAETTDSPPEPQTAPPTGESPAAPPGPPAESRPAPNGGQADVFGSRQGADDPSAAPRGTYTSEGPSPSGASPSAGRLAGVDQSHGQESPALTSRPAQPKRPDRTALDGSESAGSLRAKGQRADHHPPGQSGLPKRPVSSPTPAPSVPARAAQPAARPAEKPRRRFRWLLAALVVLLVLVAAGGGVAGYVVWHFSQNLPSLDSLRTYRPPTPTRVYSSDGVLIGEFHGEERRYVLPYEEIPQLVIHAFVAAEDAAFFEHHGVDYPGIIRAMIANIREHSLTQGASTITQQVARSFLLTREKKFERKIKEALLAYRIEANFTKEHILYLYLNQVYLGEGAYGVQSAAQVYFDKPAKDLTLAEAAMIAGLLPAPSRYSPLDHYKAARERQLYVLTSMVREGYISEAEKQAAEKEDLALKPRRNINKTLAPYVVEEARRILVRKYGDKKLLEDGLQIYTSIKFDLQQAARKAVQDGVETVDRRIGWRGPSEKLSKEEIEPWLARYEENFKKDLQASRPGGIERFGPPPAGPMALQVDEVYKAVATEVTDDYAVIRVGSQEGVIPLEDILWAYSVNPKRNWKWRKLDKVSRVLEVGDVVEVKVLELEYKKSQKLTGSAKKRFEATLYQKPAIEGSLFSYSPETGGIIALVGGYDYESSEFDRPFQARRQMGSAFKPLVYSAAMDHPSKVYTPGTILLDAPITMHKGQDALQIPGFEELWKPVNYDRDYLGEITLRKALYMSRNTVAVKLLADIGISYTYDYVKKLGIESPINKDTSMVLGSSSITLVELCRAYSAFAAGGNIVEPILVERVLDRDGNLVEERPREPEKKEVMPASTAYIMTHLLQDVVRCGTGGKALSLRKTTAGKTGTTNDFVDASYIGFTPQLVTGTWIGYDQPQSMGHGEAGSDAALPFWIEYMRSALEVYPPTRYKIPSDVVFATVDANTGKLANEHTVNRVRLPYKRGEAPVDVVPEPGQVGVEDFLSADQAP